MELSTREISDVLVVDMAGRLETSTLGKAHDEISLIAKSGARRVVLNLSNLSHMSNAGLGAILMAAKLIQASNGEMNIYGANDVVSEILEESGFNSLVKTYANEEEAISAFGR